MTRKWLGWCSLALQVSVISAQLIQNGGFESMDHWSCYSGFTCILVTDHRSGQHSVRVANRTHYYDGPSQILHLIPGKAYQVSAWVKVLNDFSGQYTQVELDTLHTDNTHIFESVSRHSNAKVADGWVQLSGTLALQNTTTISSVRLYFQSGPDPRANYQVDDVSVTELQLTHVDLERIIDQHRKSRINIHANLSSGINPSDIQLHVLQTKKSFPFGTAVSAHHYNSNAANGKYRDFIHRHFNWAVAEKSLKWPSVEPTRGQTNYQPALDMIRGLKSHGLKVRGHNLVWSVEQFVQNWVRALQGTELRHVVARHIQEIMNVTRGLLEHWDVNNENLHGTWYQDRLNDPGYNLELFRIAHAADPHVRLFLNDYNVVAGGGLTDDYLAQARQFKAAGSSVALSGMGVQCHFGNEYEPNAALIMHRLDVLTQAGVPIWATELDVLAGDENRRADFYETALRALYSHPAVEGILFWGFWTQAQPKGANASLVTGNNLDLTAAGRRVLDLLENQWMTDETHVLPSNHQLSVRGFHGDYEIRVLYRGKELTNLKQTFKLGKANETVNINIHT